MDGQPPFPPRDELNVLRNVHQAGDAWVNIASLTLGKTGSMHDDPKKRLMLDAMLRALGDVAWAAAVFPRNRGEDGSLPMSSFACRHSLPLQSALRSGLGS